MSVLSVFADWAHTEDRVELSCSYCATWSYNAVLSKSNDMAVVGLEYQRCLQTYWNGGTFSCDYKAGFMFLDDSEGWDLSAAMRYSIPVNCGRWGYVKGGYRYISIKKAQQDLLLSKSLDGGFMEFGFIF
jgi:hypothetical protein